MDSQKKWKQAFMVTSLLFQFCEDCMNGFEVLANNLSTRSHSCSLCRGLQLQMWHKHTGPTLIIQGLQTLWTLHMRNFLVSRFHHTGHNSAQSERMNFCIWTAFYSKASLKDKISCCGVLVQLSRKKASSHAQYFCRTQINCCFKKSCPWSTDGLVII